jgi:hypothetical protein
MEFLTIDLHVPIKSVQIFGHSLGTIPSIYISSLKKYSNINSLVLMSPLCNGIRFLNSKSTIQTSDIDKIEPYNCSQQLVDIICPVFFIYGLKDEVIEQQSIKEMSQKMHYVFEWYPKNGYHHNLYWNYRHKFYLKMQNFEDVLKEFYYRKSEPSEMTGDNISNNLEIFRFKKSVQRFSKSGKFNIYDNYFEEGKRYSVKSKSKSKSRSNL